MAKTYVFPKFSYGDSFGVRLSGGGLGNLLFPFSRALVVSRTTGYARLDPTWRTIKIGPVVRREKDKRFYTSMFSDGFGISGMRKYIILHTTPMVPEEACGAIGTEGNKVIVFKGLKNYFDDLRGHSGVIYEEILRITRQEHLARIKDFVADGICVHIRLGDFQPSRSLDIDPMSSLRLPMSWYVNTIKKMRAHLRRDVRVYVFSDGRTEELGEVLALRGTEYVNFGSAVGDMLALARSKVLIASNSTFSMWAAFLGRMLVVYYPRINIFKMYDTAEPFEGEVDFEEGLPERLKDDLDRLFRGGPVRS